MSSSKIRDFIAKNNGISAHPIFNDIEVGRKHQPPAPPPVVQKNNVQRRPITTIVSKRNMPTETIEIKPFDKDISKIKDRSIIFYGPSGSGKTIIIYDFMNSTRHIFPKVIVFSPTNREKKDYEGFVPKELIYEEWDLDDIRNIYEYQRAAAHIYNTANDINILHKLFERVATPPQNTYLEQLHRKKLIALDAIKREFKDFNDQKQRMSDVENIHKEILIKFYKEHVIKPNEKILENMNLSTEEHTTIKYLNYNPRVLIIFDDAMTEIQANLREGRKTNNNVIPEFFFKGRWAYITHFYAFQDDNKLDSEIKKNAFISIFTAPNVASAFFGRSATNFSAQEKAKAQAVISRVFSITEEDDEDDQTLKFRKFVYCRLDSEPFKYIIADPPGDFKMCSTLVRNYCAKVRKDESKIDRNNQYLKRFHEF